MLNEATLIVKCNDEESALIDFTLNTINIIKTNKNSTQGTYLQRTVIQILFKENKPLQLVE